MNYFRITGYCPKHNFSFILDANNVFEKLWQFSSILVRNNIEIIEISNEDKFEDINNFSILDNNSFFVILHSAYILFQYNNTGFPYPGQQKAGGI